MIAQSLCSSRRRRRRRQGHGKSFCAADAAGVAASLKGTLTICEKRAERMFNALHMFAGQILPDHPVHSVVEQLRSQPWNGSSSLPPARRAGLSNQGFRGRKKRSRRFMLARSLDPSSLTKPPPQSSVLLTRDALKRARDRQRRQRRHSTQGERGIFKLSTIRGGRERERETDRWRGGDWTQGESKDRVTLNRHTGFESEGCH